MKKFMTLLLAGAMFALAACGNSGTGETPDNNDGGNPIIDVSENGDYGTDPTPENGGNYEIVIPSGTYSADMDDTTIAFIFSEDGTFVRVETRDETVREESGSYEVEENSIIATYTVDETRNEVRRYEFILDGDTLTLIGAWFTEDLVLVRQ
jgi:predicted small lipoprotein YifL